MVLGSSFLNTSTSVVVNYVPTYGKRKTNNKANVMEAWLPLACFLQQFF